MSETKVEVQKEEEEEQAVGIDKHLEYDIRKVIGARKESEA